MRATYIVQYSESSEVAVTTAPLSEVLKKYGTSTQSERIYTITREHDGKKVYPTDTRSESLRTDEET